MEKFNGNFDRFGIGVSAFCLLHCVLLPLILTGFTMAGLSFELDVLVEITTLLLALTVGGYAMYKGYKSHAKTSFALIFVTGIILMVAANLFHGKPGEMILKSFGALILIFAHVLNYRMGNCRLKKI